MGLMKRVATARMLGLTAPRVAERFREPAPALTPERATAAPETSVRGPAKAKATQTTFLFGDGY
jgi:hypothetical protein